MLDGLRTSWKAVIAAVFTELGVIATQLDEGTLTPEYNNWMWWFTHVVVPVAAGVFVYIKSNKPGTLTNPKNEVGGILISKSNEFPDESGEYLTEV
jgi:hypothetical protein